VKNNPVHLRHEVWVSANGEPWRFNCCFDTLEQAGDEADWYRKQPGYRVELRLRTTRYQRPQHRTAGG